jgi:hypothetical protein
VVRLPAHDEPRSGRADGRRLGLALADDLVECGGRLVVLERGRVALHLEVAEGVELVDELLVGELDAVLLQLLAELMNPLLRHCVDS